MESLSFKDFFPIFENGYYPSLIADILYYVADVVVPHNSKEQIKKILIKDEPETNETRRKDHDIFIQASKMLGDHDTFNKIFATFQKLVENPNKGESRMYLTLYSLTKGFVFLKQF